MRSAKSLALAAPHAHLLINVVAAVVGDMDRSGRTHTDTYPALYTITADPIFRLAP